MTLVVRGGPTLLLGVVVIKIRLPAEPAAYVLGAVSVLLAASLTHLLGYLVNLISFWTIDASGYANVLGIALGLFGGVIVPVSLFPAWLKGITIASPFPSCFQTPVDVVSGRAAGWEGLHAVGIQLGWVLVFVAVTRVVFALGARRLVVQGG